MVKLTYGSRAQRSLFTLTALTATLMAAGCQFDVHEDTPPDAPDVPEVDPSDPPDEEPTCEAGKVVQQAFVCAGYVSEQRHVSQRLVRLEPAAASYACYTSGTGLTPFIDTDAPGPYPSTGGSSGEGGSAAAGGFPATGGFAATGGVSAGGATGDGDGDGDGDWSGDGDGDGDWEMGGAWAGGAGPVGTGGGFGYPEEDNWCSEAPEGTAISGVTYSVDACGATELRLPIRIQEPSSWYRVRVYHGESPCERGEVIADISGQGTGEILDLPVDPPSEGYVTIEYTADGSDYYYYYDDYGYGGYPGYYGGGILEVELNPVSGGLIDGE